MTETVIMTLIICLTVAFCMFLGTCGAISQAKYDKNRDHDDEDYITRKEFEEYEHLISDGLHDLKQEIEERCIKR